MLEEYIQEHPMSCDPEFHGCNDHNWVDMDESGLVDNNGFSIMSNLERCSKCGLGRAVESYEQYQGNNLVFNSALYDQLLDRDDFIDLIDYMAYKVIYYDDPDNTSAGWMDSIIKLVDFSAGITREYSEPQCIELI